LGEKLLVYVLKRIVSIYFYIPGSHFAGLIVYNSIPIFFINIDAFIL
jgi:hypothetical protein